MEGMSPPLSSTQRQALLVLPVAAGAVLGKLSDSTLISSVLLLAEPLIWLAAVHLLLYLLFTRREGIALGFLLSAGIGIMLLHVPIGATTPAAASQGLASDSLPGLADCVEPESLSPVPIRALQWTLDPNRELQLDAEGISRLQPDLVLLSGLAQPALADHLAQLLGGEAIHLVGDPETSLVIRGHFMDCGTDHTSWSMRPDPGDQSLVLFMADLAEAGPTPILSVQVGGPHSLGDLEPWHEDLGQARTGVAEVIRALGSEKLVTLGDFAAPRSFRALGAAMEAVGSSEAELPASWPSGLGPVPMPGLHALDRLWFGGAWTHQESRKVRVPSQPRALILTDLQPRSW
jgi:hypothetical protein